MKVYSDFAWSQSPTDDIYDRQCTSGGVHDLIGDSGCPRSIGCREARYLVGNIWTADYSMGFPVLWQPVDPFRHSYRMKLLNLPPGIPDNSSFPASINDLGDIAGTSYDADGNPLPSYWSTKNPSSATLLDFDGHVGVANKVNDLRMVVGGYWSDSCPPGLRGRSTAPLTSNECII